MVSLFRFYFFGVCLFLLYVLYDHLELPFWWYFPFTIIATVLFGINRDWFELRTLKQTLLIFFLTLVIGGILFQFEFIGKIILLIIAFFLFIFPNQKSEKANNKSQVFIEFTCRNCRSTNKTSISDLNKLQVRKCSQCNYYNYVKVDDELNVTVVRATPNEPFQITDYAIEKNRVQTFSGKAYSLILTVLILLSYYI